MWLARFPRKRELVERMKSFGVPRPTTRSMKGVELERAKPLG